MRTQTQLAAIWPPTFGAAREAGHEDLLPLEAIRAKCLDCSCFQPSEVRLCEDLKCPLWPFRAGRYPVGRRQPKKPEPFPDFEQAGAFDSEPTS